MSDLMDDNVPTEGVCDILTTTSELENLPALEFDGDGTSTCPNEYDSKTAAE